MNAYELCIFFRTVAVVRHIYARTMCTYADAVLYPTSTALAMYHICTTYAPYIHHTVWMYGGNLYIEKCPRIHTNTQTNTHTFTAPNRQTSACLYVTSRRLQTDKQALVCFKKKHTTTHFHANVPAWSHVCIRHITQRDTWRTARQSSRTHPNVHPPSQ